MKLCECGKSDKDILTGFISILVISSPVWLIFVVLIIVSIAGNDIQYERPVFGDGVECVVAYKDRENVLAISCNWDNIDVNIDDMEKTLITRE